MQDSYLLHANNSGRLWSEDPDEWRRLSSEAGCPICESPMPEDWVLAETPIVWVTAQAEASIPGYVCVTCKLHVIEPFDLPPEKQGDFWKDAMLAAQGVADIVSPAKMNYEIHGNTIPHLHLHLFPRTSGDPYVGFPIHNRHKYTRTKEDLKKLAQAILARLTEANRLIERDT